MIKIAFLSSLITLLLTSCSTPLKEHPPFTSTDPTIQQVLQTAYSYLGAPYRYGGNSYSGLDCSALVQLSFAQANIELPRTSVAQSHAGRLSSITHAKVGDLIFFNTQGTQISHVGIVTNIQNNTLFFIHVSESKGVIISSSENVYWKPRLVKLTRIIE